MKILVVTTSYPRFAGDAAGNFVEGHVEALRAHGHEVEVLAAGSAEPRDANRGDTNRGDANRIDATRIPSELFYRGGAPDLIEARGWRTAVDAARFTLTFAREIRRRRPDQIIAHWLAPSAIAALPSRIPLLAIAHGGDVHLLRRTRLLAPTLYALRARGARLAFVSSELRAIAQRAAPGIASWIGGATVQPMGIDIDRFRAIERSPTALPTILIVSRLVPVKGIDVAIAALGHLKTPARLVIAGDGPARAELEQSAARALVESARTPTPLLSSSTRSASSTESRATSTSRGSVGQSSMRSSFEFVGEVSADERDRLLATASVVVVPSRVLPIGRTEGTPLIALEALAAGVPVVASAIGGLAELPVHRVRPDDPRALATAIDEVLGAAPDPARLRGLVGGYAWSHVAEVLR